MRQVNYTIRDATDADAESVVAMHDQSWKDTYPNAAAGVSYEWVEQRVNRWKAPEKLEARKEQIRKSGPDKDMLYRIAENDKGEVIGLINPYRNNEVQRVGAIYVAKQYHGTGLAQKLMDEIISWSDPSRPLELEVATYNDRARAFYRKYGFKEIKDSEHLVHGLIPVIVMTRKGDKQ